MTEFEEIRKAIRCFRDQRDWLQFHNPKDMALAIAIEAAELLELFLWKNDDEIRSVVAKRQEALRDEIADIAIYLIELADNLNIDLGDAIREKLKKNSIKYPIERARGRSCKHTELP
jgi:dCTP diphosphatase